MESIQLCDGKVFNRMCGFFLHVAEARFFGHASQAQDKIDMCILLICRKRSRVYQRRK